MAAGICDENGKIILKKSIPALPEREADLIMDDMAKLCLDLIAEAGPFTARSFILAISLRSLIIPFAMYLQRRWESKRFWLQTMQMRLLRAKLYVVLQRAIPILYSLLWAPVSAAVLL